MAELGTALPHSRSPRFFFAFTLTGVSSTVATDFYPIAMSQRWPFSLKKNLNKAPSPLNLFWSSDSGNARNHVYVCFRDVATDSALSPWANGDIVIKCKCSPDSSKMETALYTLTGGFLNRDDRRSPYRQWGVQRNSLTRPTGDLISDCPNWSSGRYIYTPYWKKMQEKILKILNKTRRAWNNDSQSDRNYDSWYDDLEEPEELPSEYEQIYRELLAKYTEEELKYLRGSVTFTAAPRTLGRQQLRARLSGEMIKSKTLATLTSLWWNLRRSILL